MPSKIFVSYRRDDDPNGAARIRDALTAEFGRSSVFMDVDDLLAGLQFPGELAKALAACDMFLAIIGPRWMELLNTRASSSDRDYARAEIAEALRRKIIVIPVRVGREGQLPPLPRDDDLPPEIRELVYYEKHDVIYEHFDRDTRALIAAIKAVRRYVHQETPQATPRVPWRWIGGTATIRRLRVNRETARIAAVERQRVEETKAWGAVVASTEASAFLAFLRTWPDGQ